MKKGTITIVLLSTLVSLLFVLAAYSKLSNTKETVEMLEKLHLSDYRVGLGLIDIIIALSLWSKKTRSIGILVGTGYLGGAIVTDLSLGGTGVVPGVLMLMLWIIYKIDLRKDCSCGVCDSCIVKTVQSR